MTGEDGINLTDHLGNYSHEEVGGGGEDDLNIPYVVCELIVAGFAVFGNALVVVVFCTNSCLRHYRNYYIVSLAVADFLVGLVGIPLAILNSVGLPLSLYGCLFSLSTLLVLCTISITSLVGVSLDRIWATTNPVTYHAKMNATIANCIIAGCWVGGAFIGFLPLIGWYNKRGWAKRGRCEFTNVIDYHYLVFLYFATCLIPAILLTGIYGYIYQRVVKRIRRQTLRKTRTQSRDFTSEGESKQIEKSIQANKLREAKTAGKLGSIVLFFSVCWMPLYTINCIQAFVKFSVPAELMFFVIILSHANSAVNPLMYAYYLRDFRSPMRVALLNTVRMLTRCYCCRKSSERQEEDNLKAKSIKTLVSRSDVITSGTDLSSGADLLEPDAEAVVRR